MRDPPRSNGQRTPAAAAWQQHGVSPHHASIPRFASATCAQTAEMRFVVLTGEEVNWGVNWHVQARQRALGICTAWVLGLHNVWSPEILGGDGLICSATEKTCKPAVGAECKRPIRDRGSEQRGGNNSHCRTETMFDSEVTAACSFLQPSKRHRRYIHTESDLAWDILKDTMCCKQVESR